MAQLDLRGTPCPLNFIRTKLALERLGFGEVLMVDLDAGEPQQLVSEGLVSAGHRVECRSHPHQEGAVRLLVLRHGG
ncbi:MAG: sulfurtransferase TusA family protein [Synechococcus sp.]|nr:sulfurtransferase TusA family protein [Synechococcus sp.]